MVAISFSGLIELPIENCDQCDTVARMQANFQNTSVVSAVSASEWTAAAVAGFGLAIAVWWTLAAGGGLVGGDTYPYFFPQKQLMSQAFSEGEWPLWHDRTGLGYPLHAESQAGIFYPSNQILYRLFDVNRAYSLSVILHYGLAFVFAWRFVRTQFVSMWPAMLGAVIYVYGWFPARISLEWSIIGGVWLPAALWMTDRLLQKNSYSNITWLSLVLAVHLLAGHFALAFVTQLTCCLYAIFRAGFDGPTWPAKLHRAMRSVAIVAASIGIALCLAAVQLVPTLELKQLSQREGVNVAFDPAYGHMPPVYLTQLVASWWYWHTPEMVLSGAMNQSPFLRIDAATNQVEAHLYFGLIPFGLLLLLLSAAVRSRLPKREVAIWLAMMMLAIVYATGWLVGVTRHLPGFGFFMGPARYTIVAALSAGILTGLIVDSLLRRRSVTARILVVMVLSALTLPDLLKSSAAPVRDAVAVANPPYLSLSESWVAAFVNNAGEGNIRLLAPGPNVANLYGASCIPQYLGIGPADYYVDEKTYRVRPAGPDLQPFPSDPELAKLQERSVTHILATDPFVMPSEHIEIVNAAPDAFLNRVWGRGNAAVYLYRLRSTAERVSTADPTSVAGWSWISRTPQDVSFSIELKKDDSVILKELMFPGWTVLVDDKVAAPETVDGFERRVKVPAGRHIVRWIYQPQSFRLGAVVSSGCLLCVLVLMSFSLWRRRSA